MKRKSRKYAHGQMSNEQIKGLSRKQRTLAKKESDLSEILADMDRFKKYLNTMSRVSWGITKK